MIFNTKISLCILIFGKFATTLLTNASQYLRAKEIQPSYIINPVKKGLARHRQMKCPLMAEGQA